MLYIKESPLKTGCHMGMVKIRHKYLAQTQGKKLNIQVGLFDEAHGHLTPSFWV